MMSRVGVALGVFLAALLLGSCGLADDKAPDYRYRLTVEVDTPEGLKMGSSVIEVKQTLMRPGSSPRSRGVSRKVRGEAVAVDLPGGKTLYALLRSDNNVDWASHVYLYLAPPSTDTEFVDQLDDVLEVTGERVLPRDWPPVGFLPERSAYPTMVTFTDEADPTSITRVNPDDLATSFGDGVSLKRITAQLTNARVTTGIERRLEWLPNYYDKQLSGDRFQNIRNKGKGLSAFMSAGAFSAGVGVKDKRGY